MNGSGCKNCPVKPCETMNYRGSACAAQRAKFGLGDPMTNADRIRAMTDEELAVFLRTVEYDVEQFPFIQDWDKWLKEPAEGD